MGNIPFNADEVFEIAEEMERNGAKFYVKLYKNTSNEDLKNILQNLIAMEKDHEKVFKEIRSKITKDEWKSSFDPDDQTVAYLRALVKGHVFDLKGDPSEVINEETTIAEVLKMAIQVEKESIVFYLGIKRVTPGEMGKDLIDKIISEEIGHVGLLTEQLEAVI